MATTRGTIEAQRKRAKMKKKLDAAKARQREAIKGKRQEYLPEKVDIDAKKSLDRHAKARKNRAKNKTSPTGRAVDDVLRGIFPGSYPKSTEMEPEYSELWGRSTGEKVKRIKARNKKKASTKRGGGIVGRGMGIALRGGGAVTRGK
tara:strand:+ start:169 stop:609 length:441 start_codon:yes stop_codon:yes gene_type:complete